jgi:hypothetical protein
MAEAGRRCVRSQRLRERVRAIAVPAPRRRRVRMPALLGVVAALTFPQAVGARHSSSGATWTAQVNGVVLYCADHPAPSLVLGADRAEVLAAAQRLGLW